MRELKTITEQIAEMTTLELAALTAVLDITYLKNGNTQTYSVGQFTLDCLDVWFGDWKCADIKATLPAYHVRCEPMFSEFLTGMAIELTKQVDEHNETVTDIAPATIKQYTTQPEEKDTVKRAPFDSSTAKLDTETTHTVNNGTEYMGGKSVTEYDTTKADGHTSKVVNDKTGTNYPISKILTEEQKRRFSDFLYSYLGVYVSEYGYRVEVI